MELHDGDHVLVIHMLSEMPLGARVLGPAPHEGFIWIDLNTMGSHLPQMYRPEELKPIDAAIAKAEGLCVACLGYGVPDDYEVPLAASIDQLEHICDDCHGTGRQGMRVNILRKPDSIEARMHVDEHAFVPEMRDHECKACGMPKDHKAHV